MVWQVSAQVLFRILSANSSLSISRRTFPKKRTASHTATMNPKEKLSTFMQDTLRGPILAAIPFFNQKKVVGLLDSLNTMDEGSRVANDQVLMTVASACVLQERFRLAA
jgi:hypothetical protein